MSKSAASALIGNRPGCSVKSLHITEVVAGDIAIVTKRTPPKEEEPSKEPARQQTCRYRLSTVWKPAKSAWASVFDKQTRLSRPSAHDLSLRQKEHRLHIKTADTPWSSSTGASGARFEQTTPRPQYRHLHQRPAGRNHTARCACGAACKDINTDFLLDNNDHFCL